MLSLPPTVRVFIIVEPVNMHGSFDSLAGVVRRLGLDPVDGHFYVMLSKRRHIAKVLWFDGSGWRILAKRLEKGTFEIPEVSDGARQIAVDHATLAALLDGIDLRAERRHWFQRSTG